MKLAIRILFGLYWAALTFLLLVYNPFEWVPIDEEFVERGFGINLSPHTLTFLLLAILMCACRWKWTAAMWGALVAYAFLTEYLQGFTGRTPDWADVFDNLVGLAVGGFAWWLVHRVWGRSS